MDVNFLIKNDRVNNSISQNPIIEQISNVKDNNLNIKKLIIKKLIIFTNGFTLNAANLLSTKLKEISIECLVLKEFISLLSLSSFSQLSYCSQILHDEEKISNATFFVPHITCAKVCNKKEVMSINKFMSTFSHSSFQF